MNNRPTGASITCEEFLEELERLPLETSHGHSAAEWLKLVAEPAQRHSVSCANCRAALEDFVETREALAPMKEGLPEPGPFFFARVMAKIREQEREIEEQTNGVWINVMRLAPRLAAFAAVLLVLGGTWALQLRRAENNRRSQPSTVEGLFESAPSAPVNDDIVAVTYEEHQP